MRSLAGQLPARSRAAWVALAGAAVAALAAAFVLPVEAYLALAALVFIGAIALIAFSWQMDNGAAGFTLLVVTGVAMPIEFRGVAGVAMSASLPLAAFLCAAWLLRSISAGSFHVLDRSRVVWAAAAYVAVVLVAFGAGQYPWFDSAGAPVPAQVAQLGLMLVSVFLFLAVGHQVTSEKQLKTLTWLFVAAGVVALLVQTVPALSVVGSWTTRPRSIGSLFWTWLVAVSLAQALFNRQLRAPVRLALLAIAAGVLFHGLFTVRSWASGWLPALVAVGVILLVRLPRLGVSAALVLLPLAMIAGGYLTDTVLAEEEYSLITRQEAWRVLWNIVQRSPVVGTGLANYYYYAENFPIMGWYVRFISHNNYQDLLVQTGVLGLAAFGWLAFEMLWMVVQTYRRVAPGFAQAYVVGALGGLCGSLASGMLGDWILPFYYNAGLLGFRSSLLFWVFLGGVLALKRASGYGLRATGSASERVYT